VDLAAVGNIGTVDKEEVEVAGDTSRAEKLDKVTSSHEELRAKINRPVARIAKVLGNLRVLRAETLVQVNQANGSSLATIVGVLIKSENLHTLLLKNSRKNTDSGVSTQTNEIVLFVHLCERIETHIRKPIGLREYNNRG
jgi:hypothetical protein